MKSIKDLTENEGIHAPTFEIAAKLCSKFNERSITSIFLTQKYWFKYRENTVYYPANGTYGSIVDAIAYNYKIYTIEQLDDFQTFEINKGFLQELYGYSSSEVRGQLETLYPDLFGVKFEIGEWYKHVTGSIINYQGGNKTYGFDTYGVWLDIHNDWFPTDYPQDWTPATDSEVNEMFKKESIKRFGEDWENAKLEECLWNKKGTNSGVFTPIGNTKERWNINGMYFRDGQWAKPLTDTLIKVSLERAKKIVAEEYGTTPENIIIN